MFERVKRETGGVDILVNKVWGGYEKMVEDGVFTWSKPFWGRTVWRLDAMFSAGVRAHYYASQLAAKSMVSSRRGLILNIMSREMMFQVPCSCLRSFPFCSVGAKPAFE